MLSGFYSLLCIKCMYMYFFSQFLLLGFSSGQMNSHLCSCHFVSQGLQVCCRVLQSLLVGTWAAAVLWLSFRMRWMWNDSLSDADCCTSLISYPCKQMLISYRGISFWQKQYEDVRCDLWAGRIVQASEPNRNTYCIELYTGHIPNTVR